MEKVFIFMEDGTEECEALITLDILKRANLDVKLVSCKDNSNKIISSHNVKLECDLNLLEINENDADCFVIPGGVIGVENFNKNEKLQNVIKKANKKNKIIASICAGPTILEKCGIIQNLTEATCYPGYESNFKNIYKFKKVCKDKNIITARSLGSTFEFAFEILSKFKTKEEIDIIKESIHFNVE